MHLAWLVLGLICLAAQAGAVGTVRSFFLTSQPFFASPIRVDGVRIPLRNDSYGKGHFDASRNGGRRHKGIDILAPVGAPVLAPKSGRVTRAHEDKGYGRVIEIFHPDGRFTRYAHLMDIHVNRGDWVNKGQVIGLCGKSGNAINPHILPHLHFEIRSSSDALNPSDYLDPALVLVNKNLKK